MPNTSRCEKAIKKLFEVGLWFGAIGYALIIFLALAVHIYNPDSGLMGMGVSEPLKTYLRLVLIMIGAVAIAGPIMSFLTLFVPCKEPG